MRRGKVSLNLTHTHTHLPSSCSTYLPQPEAPPGSTGKLPTSTPTLIQRKTTLEHLYNRAASSSTVDQLQGSSRLRTAVVRSVERDQEVRGLGLRTAISWKKYKGERIH